MARSCKVLSIFLCALFLAQSAAGSELLKTKDIRVRDPFVYADPASKTYYLYAQSTNRGKTGFIGVEAYASEDLDNWQPPKPVLILPGDAGIRSVWAPEVHEFNGTFYLFVTLTFKRTLPVKKPVDSDGWPEMYERGTYIYRADAPTGPFKPLKTTSHTPKDWMTLDGTLYVEEGTPYMVFCHEWVQTIDGTMDAVQLKDDLSDTVGDPQLLFKASEAPGARKGAKTGKITDGCFLYRSPESGKLFMIWSTDIPGNGYCVVLTESQSGKIAGPWIKQKLLYKNDGGHGMLFRTFDGKLLLALHQPNTRARERLHLYEVVEKDGTLEIAAKPNREPATGDTRSSSDHQ